MSLVDSALHSFTSLFGFCRGRRLGRGRDVTYHVDLCDWAHAAYIHIDVYKRRLS